MYLTHLSLTDFRNFTRLDVDVPCGSVLLVGDNAQGKTSLLEAIYFLATMVSFHAGSDRQLINFIAARQPLAVARIVADFRRTEPPSGSPRRKYAGRGSETTGEGEPPPQRCSLSPHSPVGRTPTGEGEAHRLEVRIIQEPNSNGEARLRKEVLLDGVKCKTSECVGQLNAVLFLPQMLRVIEGAPDERRRYLNLALAQVVAHYPDALSDYTRALTQRNALLKQLYERGGDAAQLDFWDEQLAALGAQLIHARIRAVKELERLAARLHRELTHGEEVLRLCYQPAYDPLPRPQGQYALPLDAPVDRSGFSVEQIRQGFLQSLADLRAGEIARGMTTLGPHRDEIRFLSNGVDLGVYGSRGQARTAMLSLKLAEVAWMKEKTGHRPVLLLDEVLAELDTQRRADLLSRLFECEQALLTTTDLDLFDPEFVRGARVWRVQGGRIMTSDE